MLVVIALARGWLVTARELKASNHDRDEWRTECRIKDAQIGEKDAQLRHLKEVGEIVKQFAQGLQREIER